jgi:hypothetical protein
VRVAYHHHFPLSVDLNNTSESLVSPGVSTLRLALVDDLLSFLRNGLVAVFDFFAGLERKASKLS